MAAKKPKKSARKSPRVGRPFQPGKDARRGRGPAKGTGGRPPDAFKAMCRELSSSAAVEQSVRKILSNPNHPAFTGALKWAAEHGYGKPNQPVEHGVSAGLAEAIRAARLRAGIG